MDAVEGGENVLLSPYVDLIEWWIVDSKKLGAAHTRRSHWKTSVFVVSVLCNNSYFCQAI